jgi:acetate kinase
MKIVALNSGSATLKFSVFNLLNGEVDADPLARGIVEHIGGDSIDDFRTAEGLGFHVRAQARDPGQATRQALDWLLSKGLIAPDDIACVSHRIVHGGEDFSAPVLLDEQRLTQLEALSGLAPLHNAPSIAAIHAAQEVLGPDVPMVATFDTAFHATIPAAARTYAIDTALARKNAIHRYGFHGFAHRSIAERYAASVGDRVDGLRLVCLQLGGGCSAVAIDRGRSVDTSMGLTPLEGLVMSTRSGDIDPAIVSYLAEREQVPADVVVDWLNRRSGLLGLSGGCDDMRDLLEREAHGDGDASLAIAVFCHRARKYLGAYLAVLGGADAVCFGGGIGENSPTVRERICASLEFCGLSLSAERNDSTRGQGRISTDNSAIDVWTVHVDEESLIAEDAASTLGRGV